MSVANEHEALVRTPMTWQSYLALDDSVRGEYYDGALVTMAPPGRTHQRVEYELQKAIESALAPGTVVTRGWGWSPPGVREELIPDLMVHPSTDRERNLDVPPYLVVEILSTNRRDDLVAKLNRYAQWGAPACWIVDPRDHVVLTHRLDRGYFAENGRFTSGPVALRYGEVEVAVDLDHLLR